MPNSYIKIISADENDRRDLFTQGAVQLGTTLQNVEKNFWVCWVLNEIFNSTHEDAPRVLFKGGTSLSKAYGLIERFSEDIDITIFREDLGIEASIDSLKEISKGARKKKLNEIRNMCKSYIQGNLRSILVENSKKFMEEAGQDPEQLTVTVDEEDPDGQTLLVRYPTVTEADGYIAPMVKVEAGAKSALDPHENCIIEPYISPLITDVSFTIPNVIIIRPERTFLDKVLILHGQPIFFLKNERLYGRGRISRHYYDIHCLIKNGIGEDTCYNNDLVNDCIEHARYFFYRKDTGLDEVSRGAFKISPPDAVLDFLRQDYIAMQTMIFGEVPDFEQVLASIKRAEGWLNDV
jgi:hypothetical protein